MELFQAEHRNSDMWRGWIKFTGARGGARSIDGRDAMDRHTAAALFLKTGAMALSVFQP
jgi:hypothetical protein